MRFMQEKSKSRLGRKVNSMNEKFIPETLQWCREHYVPVVKEYVRCKEFGNSDGMSGSCWWCMEMTPYEWHMCQDESWIRGLMSPLCRFGQMSRDRDEATKFIEEYKVKNTDG